MSFLRLALCVIGVYSMFLLWAIAQERLAVPFQSIREDTTHKFNSPLALSACQSTLSSISALLYLYFRRTPDQSWARMLGLDHSSAKNDAIELKEKKSNGSAISNVSAYSNGGASHHSNMRYSPKQLLLHYFQCSVLITSATPFGFAALSYITYPAMVLGKSCKLVPVMIMNVLLYRRHFARYKYVVVAMVTLGITMFFGFGKEKPAKAKSNGNGELGTFGQLVGVILLLINLAIDGATNSTQDEIFSRFKVTGQQMMFWINVFNTLISATISILPLPYIPVLHTSRHRTEFEGALEFIRDHPTVVRPMLQFAFTGALGQLFIFETLQHFGSLTLVTITLTRKLFTMLLSVAIYNHKLTPGQWLGAAVVFAGISVEAWVKRRDVHPKRVIQEKEKARIKSL